MKSFRSAIRKIPDTKLGKSEPNPAWFGNAANEPNNKNWTNKNWLKSRFHFSFAEYNNMDNQNFGVLRVMNDDLVQPDRGFGSHPHRDTEICTYIVEGSLTHKDSIGTEESLGRGAIQFMTAGTGVVHSEHNLDKTNPLRFIQIWINTRQRGLSPNYGSFSGDLTAQDNRWSHLVSDVKANDQSQAKIKINQDANIHVAEITGDNTLTFEVKEGRQAYLLCVEGDSQVSNAGADQISLTRHDAAEVYGPLTLTVTPKEVGGQKYAHMLMVEMNYTGSGRSDL